MKTERSSNKIFIIIIALLLAANIGTLAMLLAGSRQQQPEDHKNAMRSYLQKEIGFSAKQLADFDTIKNLHRSSAKSMFEQMRLNKTNNLKKLSANAFSDSALKVSAEAAAAEQQNMEMKMLQHLRDIRNLCTPPQRAIFDTGFYKVMARPAPDAKKKEN